MFWRYWHSGVKHWDYNKFSSITEQKKSLKYIYIQVNGCAAAIVLLPRADLEPLVCSVGVYTFWNITVLPSEVHLCVFKKKWNKTLVSDFWIMKMNGENNQLNISFASINLSGVWHSGIQSSRIVHIPMGYICPTWQTVTSWCHYRSAK